MFDAAPWLSEASPQDLRDIAAEAHPTNDGDVVDGDHMLMFTLKKAREHNHEGILKLKRQWEEGHAQGKPMHLWVEMNWDEKIGQYLQSVILANSAMDQLLGQ